MSEVIQISEHDIAKYVYQKLIALGYVPDADEILDLAKIFFDYLVDKQALHNIEELEEYYDEEI
mgnify:CR=1 FL=1